MELLLPPPFRLIILATLLILSSPPPSFSLQPRPPVTASTRRHDNSTDLQALLNFRSLADPHGLLSSNWTTSASFCDWHSVLCSRRRQRVTGIHLEDIPLQEYATSGTVSRMSDVYGFGILLLEMITGKKPTSVFGEQSNLREWISKAHSNMIMDIMDQNILKFHDTNNDLQKLLQCVSSVIKLGLLCSNYLPKERMPMTDITTRLQKIKIEYLSSSVAPAS